MKIGEIYLIKLSEIKGHEQSGFRPGIIVSKEIAGMIGVVPLTTKLNALRYHLSINIKKSLQNKLDSDSVALIFQLRSMDKRRIKTKLGEIEKNYLLEINKNIKEFFEII
jgi:mRNA interferase MazF